jgi:xanthine dehydrogenase YagT iron-sulfur-binding subunit
MAENDPDGVSRRGVLLGGGVVLPVTTGLLTASSADASKPVDPRAGITVELTVNGLKRRLTIDPRTTLLDAVREDMGLTGSKKGCDQGQCGACTMHVGGRRVLGCLTLAASVREPVTTIEGLGGAGGALHPLQQAFLDQDALQCGYCTPGQIMAGVACINEGHAQNPSDIREYMSGNLCRCGAYPHIVAAIQQAKSQMGRG